MNEFLNWAQGCCNSWVCVSLLLLFTHTLTHIRLMEVGVCLCDSGTSNKCSKRRSIPLDGDISRWCLSLSLSIEERSSIHPFPLHCIWREDLWFAIWDGWRWVVMALFKGFWFRRKERGGEQKAPSLSVSRDMKNDDVIHISVKLQRSLQFEKYMCKWMRLFSRIFFFCFIFSIGQEAKEVFNTIIRNFSSDFFIDFFCFVKNWRFFFCKNWPVFLSLLFLKVIITTYLILFPWFKWIYFVLIEFFIRICLFPFFYVLNFFFDILNFFYMREEKRGVSVVNRRLNKSFLLKFNKLKPHCKIVTIILIFW